MGKLTGPACRAGRALLGWSMRDLAEAANVSLPALLRIENGGEFRQSTEDKILETFARHRVEITNGQGTGARLLSSEGG